MPLPIILAGIGGYIAGGAVLAAVSVASALYQQNQFKKQQKKLKASLDASREAALGQDVRHSNCCSINSSYLWIS